VSIDSPLLLWWNDQAPRAIVRNWRGSAAGALLVSNGPSNGLSYPSARVRVQFEMDSRMSAPPPNAWLGSLIDEQRDSTGLLCRRNRYYDPATGRFTQEDPIGLAGGMNLYGYAGGDPVNFSDPFGLCTPFPECLAQAIADWGAFKGGAVGSVALNAGAALNATFEATGMNLAGQAGAELRNGQVAEGTLHAAMVFGRVPGGGATKAVGGKITGFTRHGLNQAISNDGVGVAGSALLGAVKNPLQVVPQARGAAMYIGENATVVLNESGKVITTWATTKAGWRIAP